MTSIVNSSSDQISTYDDVPYPSHPYQATHPDHLYTLARLLKVEATIPDGARILELGCASGGNIIPMAEQIPSAHFVGVDLSSKQIEEGKKTVQAVGLKNIELLDIDFGRIDKSLGEFDYIICHGVFSWVSKEAQRKILQICNERLTANGIAYVSYNAYPGWFMRGMIREMMLHHIRNLTDPKQKVAQARALLSFLVTSTEGQTTPYANCLKEELELLSKHSDAYLFHDHLEVENNPMFFFQFMDLARPLGLQFLTETSLPSMITSNLAPKAAEALTKLTNDVHQRSQYTDFVTNRMFRQSLLCRSNIQVNRNLDETRFQQVRFMGAFHIEVPTGSDESAPDVEVTYKCANGRTIRTSHSVLKALFRTLADAWPASLTGDQIIAIVESKLSQSVSLSAPDGAPVSQICKTNLIQMAIRGDIAFRLPNDRFTTAVSDRPQISQLARLQTKLGQNVTTRSHGMITPDPMTRLVMQLLDGGKTKSDLLLIIQELVNTGKVKVTVQGNQQVELPKVLGATIDKILWQMSKQGLLLG